MNGLVRIAALFALLLAIAGGSAFAAKVADIANTKHNLSSTGPGTVKATSETQICVFCHTPHGAQNIPKAPIWNRALSAVATYTTYTSESLKSTPGQPENSSKLCLSCHDGTMALGNVGVLNGAENVSIAGVGATTMPAGSGTATGFTRNLGGASGSDLTNDHPISFTYDSTLASLNGELRDPATNTYIATRLPNTLPRPSVPLEEGKMQCITCHDPHIRDTDLAKNAKFLRLNRLQEAAAGGGAFSAASDQVCLGCHDKAGWSGSAHVNTAVATQTYSAAAATQREFPANLPVWQAGCLNCHDTHTVQGARRLLREGTDSVSSPKAGGNPALEETCYQCHDGTTTVLNSVATVPNIKADFNLAIRMPIKSSDQPAGSEVHAITGKDFTESQLKLGKGDLNNRHAECTDCHNPHRVIKNRLFNANPATPDAAGTHTHTLAAGQTHSNLASGVLAGAAGVEPVYGATAWDSLPASYTLKNGNGGVGASTAVGSAWVTREYQICLKCHSDYAYVTPPLLGGLGLTPSGTNGMTQYTNQAMEFQAPAADKGEPGANHRSWHPVMDSTGRTAAIRGMNANNFLAPWNDATATNIGNQTMYCTDCHGSNVTSLTSVIPDGGEDGNPWGPHGSGNNFLLKGAWNNNTGRAGATDTGICFRCHDWNQYANPNNFSPQLSGWRVTGGFGGCVNYTTTNLHIGHASRIGRIDCSWCHVAVPHGWKNKALLININDAPPYGCSGAENCTQAPYLMQGYLGGNGGINWKASGQWTANDCGGANWMNNFCGNPQ